LLHDCEGAEVQLITVRSEIRREADEAPRGVRRRACRLDRKSRGEIQRDGRPDLVSRDTSGNVWRNSGDGKGSFGSRTKIATGWGGYRSLS